MGRDKAKVTITSVSLADDVLARITALDDNIRGKVWIVPTITREGSTYYDPNDVCALKLARKAGLDASYLVPANERRYIEEFSAEWVLELALAITQNLTVDIAASIGAYVLERAREALQLGQHNGSDDSVPIRLSLAEYERTVDGAVKLKNLQIEGNASRVAEAVRALVSEPERKSHTTLEDTTQH